MANLRFIKALFTPFKPFKLKFYIGKVKHGTPYFLPRRWVKATPTLAHEATLRTIKSDESFNSINPNLARKIKSYEETYKEKLRCSYPIPRKIGFDFVSLGWKTKWEDTDYRYEWSPLLSFVFFKLQICIFVSTPEPYHYWTAWLYYENDTDKTLSKSERIIQCQKEFPLTYKSYSNNTETLINYYEVILKPKYIIKDYDTGTN